MGHGDPLTCPEVTASKVRVRERREARDKQGAGAGAAHGSEKPQRMDQGKCTEASGVAGWQFYAISPQPREWGTEAPSILKITF